MDKIHLFDIDIPGKITYKESDTFTAGKKICVFDTEFCKIGLGICYDLRFAELGLLMSQQGARVLVYPGSFNQTTGPLHWELLLRGRALDTQCYTVGVSCAQYK
jgi:omega-amidase